MIKPSLGELLKQVENRYQLVIATAKRARMIGEGGTGLVECKSNKPVSIALNEIAVGKVKSE